MSAPTADPGPLPLRLQLFGPFEVFLDDRPLPRLRSRKSLWLLALLALRHGAEVERDWLAALLWPEHADRQALRNSLAELRRALGPEAARLRSPTFHTVSLELSGAMVDVAAFDAAIARGEPASVAAAVGLYRGPLLEGCTEEWVCQEREAREQSYLSALEKLATEALASGEWATAEGHLRRAAAVDPLREGAQRGLMEVLAASGNYAGALLTYRELRQRLHRELNTEPDDETQALFQQLRADGREKAAARRQMSHPREGARRRTAGGSKNEPALAVVPSAGPASGAWRLASRANAENRLVTVLCAGMCRSVETMQGMHPEEAAALVNRLLGVMEDAILKFGGQVDRFLGDGVMAIFGTPRAHEDDAERAIRAALEIREAARGLEVDVAAGINTGEVYLGGPRSEATRPPSEHPRARTGALGAARSPEVTLAGAVVSLAAQLHREAKPGEILVGEGAYRQTRRAFEFAPFSQGIPGLDQAAAAYAVERALTRAEKARGIEGLRADLIGREEPIAKIQAALAAVVQGRGQMVSLIGEAGVGKSRLVSELKALTGGEVVGWWGGGAASQSPPHHLTTSPPHHPLWLEGRSLELTMGTGYSVFVDLFRDYFAWRPEADDRARGARLADWLQELATRGELDPARVEEMRPLLGHMLSARFESDQDERLQKGSPEQVQYQTFLAVRDALIALARRQPIFVVLEDLHWADSLSLGLISLLMESLPRAPIGLLCVYRPERESPHPEPARSGTRCSHLATIAERKCQERFTEIRLRELTPEQSGRLVASLLPGEDLPHSLQALILDKSRGNPLFLEELVRSLIDARQLYRDGERWRARHGVETITVPDTVQSLIFSRFDRLRPELKQLLQGAAVIGAVFRPRLLEGMLATDRHPAGSEDRSQPPAAGLSHGLTTAAPLSEALWELEDQGLVYELRAAPEAEYSFKHVLMQETIYRSMLRRQRTELHARVAEAMESLYRDALFEHYEQLAHQYEQASPLSPLVRGSGAAAAEKAVHYLLRSGEKAKRAYLNEDAIGYFQRALARLDRRADGGTEGGERRLEALHGLGETYLGIGKQPEAEARFRQAIALGQEMNLSPRELARLYYGLGDAVAWQGRAAEMIGPAEEMLALLGERDESVEAALMNEMAGVGYRWRGNREKGIEYIRRNARFLQRLPYSEELRIPYDSVLFMYALGDDNVEEATKWLEVLEERARRHHDLRALGNTLSFRASLLQFRGDVRGAIAPLQQALEPYGKIGGAGHLLNCWIRLTDHFLTLGELQKAEASVSKQLEIAEATGDKRCIGVALLGIGKVWLCQGRWDQALDAYQKAAQVGRDDRRLLTWAHYALGRAALARGNPRDAREHLEEALALHKPELLVLVDRLSALEEAFDDPDAFRAFCQCHRAEHPEACDFSFLQWYAEPAQPHPGLSIRDTAWPASDHSIPKGEWVWHDPLGDCSLTARNGLEIRAANCRDLWHPNRSAPRLLRPVGDLDFALQAVCCPVSGDLPAIGGLLLWSGKEHYLHLDWGARGPHELSLGACLPGRQSTARLWPGEKEVVLGRGRLATERIVLRLERIAGTVRALCSADGRHWFTVGQCDFPPGDLEIGLHAIGNIQRMIYPGAYPEGTAIRFESVELWT